MKHNSAAPLRSIPPIRLTISAISIILSAVLALAAFGVPVGTSWTYQGQLRRSGAAYTGTCNFQFSLWDAASGGLQVGDTQAINGVNVANGLFTVTLDFGETPGGFFSGQRFMGEARWLATSVQCSGDGGFTLLDPRQSITATPYALSLRPGATIRNDAVGGDGLEVIGDSKGVYASAVGDSGSGVYGRSFGGPNSAGVFGLNSNGPGVWGRSTGGGSAVYGENNAGGFAGRFVGPVDIAGKVNIAGSLSAGLLVATNASSNGSGVAGIGAFGVYGQTNLSDGSGVVGQATGANSAGVLGLNNSSAAIWGRSTGVGSAIYGENLGTGFAGRFIGPVHVQGNFSKAMGSFLIDHPLDPANKFLSHSFVESPDMMNIYNGNVTTDAAGSAIVTLPDYFAALNRDPRYQLTVVGQFAQAIVSRKIAGNSFEIRTDKPGVEVSWQVTGIRQDAYAKEHPIVVEEFKPAEERGLYLYPAGFGAGEEKRIGHAGSGPGPGVSDGSRSAPKNQGEDK
ncbi:hypothetical protein BH20VER1_BH20VER1_20480 [soil metagenome]